MITYQQNLKTGGEIVKLDGAIVGEIRSVVGGYQYFPKGQKSGGVVWSTRSRCKFDIESDI